MAAAERVIPLDHCEMTFADYFAELKSKAEKAVDRYSRLTTQYDVILKDADTALDRAGQELKTRGADHGWFYYYLYAVIVGELLLKNPVSKEPRRAEKTKELRRTFLKACDCTEVLKPKVEEIYKREIARVRQEEQQRRLELQKELAGYIRKVPEAEHRDRHFLGRDESKQREELRLRYLSERPTTRGVFGAAAGVADVDGAHRKPDALDELLRNATPPSESLAALTRAQPAPAGARSTGLAALLADDIPPTRQPAAAHVDPAARPARSIAQDILMADSKPAAPQARGVGSLFAEDWKQELAAKHTPQTAQAAATADVLQRADQLLSDRAADQKRAQDAEAAAQRARDEQLQRQRESEAVQRRLDETRARHEQAAQQKLQELEAERVLHEAELRKQQQQYVETQQRALADIRRDALPLIQHAAGLLEEARAVALGKHVARCRILEADGEQIAQTVHSSLEATVPRLKALAGTHQADPAWGDLVRQVHSARDYVAEAVRLGRDMRARGLGQRAPAHAPSPYAAASPGRAASVPAAAAHAQPNRLTADALHKERMIFQRRRAQLREQMQAQARWSLSTSGGAATQHRRGFVNLGNTCYMNSLLQSLMGTNLILPFLDGSYMRDINRINPLGSQGRVVNTFQKIVDDMQSPSGYPISPSLFKQAVGRENEMFQGQSQQDSNEFMQTLLACLHEDLNRARRGPGGKAQPVPEIETKGKTDDAVAAESQRAHRINNDSLITDQMGCLEKSRLRCPGCGYQSVSFTTHTSLSLPVPDDATLSDCLMKYTEEEQLEEGCEWKCPGCSKKVRAFKQLSFYSPPKLLVLTLNRFRTTGNLADKIRTPVIFPPTLDFRPYVTRGGGTYELVAVVNHDGGVGGGHYTADVKGRQDKKWFRFSDTRVTPASGPPNFAQAYILFYQLLP